MAQQQGMDSALFERRLRPVYGELYYKYIYKLIFINGCVLNIMLFQLLIDNLEVGNNRKALQESEKLLRKHPNLLCARALKVSI